MFGIIVFLLKCIGILLLVIIGIILFIVLTILFSPIRYQAKAEKTNTLCGDFQIKWIFGLVSVSGKLQQGQEHPILHIRIFGKSLTQKKHKKRKQPNILYTRENTQKQTKTPPRSVTPQTEIQTQQSKPIPKAETAKEPNIQKKQPIRRVKLEDIQETPPSHIKPNKTHTIQNNRNGQKTDADDIDMDWKTIWKMILAYDQKKSLTKAIWCFIKGLTKNILPNQLYCKATLGTGDPVLTGYLLAITGILKGKFGENLDIKGDFAKAAAENIIFVVKGHILLWYLAYLTARFVLSKPVRHIIILLWKGRK